MKRATVYCRGDGWYLGAMSQTTTGLWIGTPPDIKVSNDAGDDRLGQAVMDCLNASRQSIAHPTKWDKDLFKPMLDLARVRSWNEFSKGAASVDVSIDEVAISVQPFKNAGPEIGYTPLPHKDISIPLDSTPEAIGAAVKQAVALCE